MLKWHCHYLEKVNAQLDSAPSVQLFEFELLASRSVYVATRRHARCTEQVISGDGMTASGASVASGRFGWVAAACWLVAFAWLVAGAWLVSFGSSLCFVE